MSKLLYLYGDDIAIVDDDDYLKFNKYIWRVVGHSRKRYVGRMGTKADGERNRKTIYLHREIMNPECLLQVDHIDGDTFNNVKSNLRICSAYNNSVGRSNNKGRDYKGVFKTRNSNYIARIRVNGKLLNLGTRSSVVEAAKLYNIAALRYFGNFAKLNNLEVL